MPHKRDIGRCHKCGERIVSTMTEKDHVIGDVTKTSVMRWRGENDKMTVA